MYSIKDKIYKELKKCNEKVLFDVFISNYDNTNFYVGVIFNKNIHKYKVLFIPLDIVDMKHIKDYFCYQFIYLDDVNYLISILEDNQIHSDKDIISKYLIEINTYNSLENNNYKFRQIITDNNLFDFFVTLFQYVPNYMDELLKKILVQFNSRYEVVKYSDYFEFDLFEDNLTKLFGKKRIVDVTYLEKLGNKFYGIIDSHKYLIENKNGLIKIYNESNDILDENIYSMIKSIRSCKYHKFSHMQFIIDSEVYYLLCYGVDFENEIFLIHNNLVDYTVCLSDLVKGRVKFDYIDDDLNELLLDYLNGKYTKKRVNEIINEIFV